MGWIRQSTLCRLVPRTEGTRPAPQLEPNVIEHFVDDPAPTRTYSNLLESGYEDALFEHYFTVELARIGVDGSVDGSTSRRG